MSAKDFDRLFTKDRPVIRLTYRRTKHRNLHVRGFEEEGTTTPFDRVVMNDLDRFPGMGARSAYLKQALRDKLIEHAHFILEHGEDMPEITGWKWGQKGAAKRAADTGDDNA